MKIVDKIIAASPDKKVKEIETLSGKAGFSEVGVAFRQIYDPVIRNAVYHSDYVVQADSMRLLSGNWLTKKGGHYTALIPFDELGELTSEAFAFHSALLALYRRACRSFTDFKGAFLPYDLHYKALLELTFDDDLITGFRTYWPNGTIGAYVRSGDSMCLAQNIRFRTEGSIDFMVGIIASRPGPFSPCVEFDAQPIYAKVPGTELQPYWPTTDGRQLEVPVVLPHLEMLPKNQARCCPEFESAAMKIFRPSGPFCRILDLVGEAEAGSGGDQPAKE